METQLKKNLVKKIISLLEKKATKGITCYLSVKNNAGKSVMIRISDHPGRKNYSYGEIEVISFINKDISNEQFRAVPEIDKLKDEFVTNSESEIKSILERFGISEEAEYHDFLTPGLFRKKIEANEAKVLTLDSARQLKGKRIAWMYFGYNPSVVNEMIVGDIVSSWDYNEKQPCEGYKSRTDYWQSYMKKEQLQREKETLLLLDAEGKNSYIKCHSDWNDTYEEPTFTCSDANREVYYIIVG